MMPEPERIRSTVDELDNIDKQIVELRGKRKKLLEGFNAAGGLPFVLRHVLHLRKMDFAELAKLDEAERSYRLALDIHVAELGPTPLEAAIDKADEAPADSHGSNGDQPRPRARGRTRNGVINIGALS